VEVKELRRFKMDKESKITKELVEGKEGLYKIYFLE